MLYLIAAFGKRRELGRENKLLWNLPSDLKNFYRYTFRHPIIMGRKTYESIGRPLPNRKNIVISRKPGFRPVGVDVVDELETAVYFSRSLDRAPVVIGGAQVYSQVLPFVTHMCLTFVDGGFPGADTFFPEVDFSEWDETSRTHFPADSSHLFSFDIAYFVRKGISEQKLSIF
jgi:dihydrofolate reductase